MRTELKPSMRWRVTRHTLMCSSCSQVLRDHHISLLQPNRPYWDMWICRTRRGDRRNAHRILSGKHEGLNLWGVLGINWRLSWSRSLSGYTAGWGDPLANRNRTPRLPSPKPSHCSGYTIATTKHLWNTNICDYINPYRYQWTFKSGTSGNTL